MKVRHLEQTEHGLTRPLYGRKKCSVRTVALRRLLLYRRKRKIIRFMWQKRMENPGNAASEIRMN